MGCNRTLLVMWCHWHHMTPMEWISLLHSLGKDNWNEMQHHFLVMWHHWNWHHLITMALLMTSLHSFSQDDQNEVHYFFGHVTPLVLASAPDNSNGIVNDTIAFLRSRCLKWGATWCFWSSDATDKASHDINGIVNGTWHWYQNCYSHW